MKNIFHFMWYFSIGRYSCNDKHTMWLNGYSFASTWVMGKIQCDLLNGYSVAFTWVMGKTRDLYNMHTLYIQNKFKQEWFGKLKWLGTIICSFLRGFKTFEKTTFHSSHMPAILIQTGLAVLKHIHVPWPNKTDRYDC